MKNIIFLIILIITGTLVNAQVKNITITKVQPAYKQIIVNYYVDSTLHDTDTYFVMLRCNLWPSWLREMKDYLLSTKTVKRIGKGAYIDTFPFPEAVYGACYDLHYCLLFAVSDTDTIESNIKSFKPKFFLPDSPLIWLVKKQTEHTTNWGIESTVQSSCFGTDSTKIFEKVFDDSNLVNLIYQKSFKTNQYKVTDLVETGVGIFHFQWIIVSYFDGIPFGFDTLLYSHEVVLTSIEEKPQQKIFLYPNPTSDYLNIEPYNNTPYVILNTMGQIVKAGNNSRIEVSEFIQGVYFLRFNNALNTYRFVKK